MAVQTCCIDDRELTISQNRHVAPWDASCLTPLKLSRFYRLVGGNYDPLFLDTPWTSLSFIYQSLGCFHTLQPGKDPYAAPSVPALTPEGFVRWQTVQVLLGPEEHVPFLQEAVKRFDLINPANSEPFPKTLPKEALPCEPDLEMTQWHDAVSEKLRLEAQAAQARSMPTHRPIASSDIDLDSVRPSSADSLSVGSQSVIDAASYFQRGPLHTHAFRPRPSFISPPSTSRTTRPVHPSGGPWSPFRRQCSFPGYSSHQHLSRPPRERNGRSYLSPQHSTHTRARTPSTLSTSSCSSDSSSMTSSSTSLSPIRDHSHRTKPRDLRPVRRNSIGVSLHRPISHPNVPFPSYHRPPAPPSNNAGPAIQQWRGQNTTSPSFSPKQTRGWVSPKRRMGAIVDAGLNRAKSVGARPLSGRSSKSWMNERRRTDRHCSPERSGWR